MFEVSQPINDPYPNLYHYANKCRLLQSLLVLISSPVTGNHPVIVSSIKILLQKFIHSHHGLLYLSSQTEITCGIIKFTLNVSVSIKKMLFFVLFFIVIQMII